MISGAGWQQTMNHKAKNLVIFASGEGSNFKAIHNRILSGDIPGVIRLVISNNPRCGAIRYADEYGIDNHIINRVRYPGETEYEKILLESIQWVKTDLVILAGYLKMIPAMVIRKYRHRMVNIHPALLPAFGGKGYYGIQVHRAVIKSGVKYSGATAHFVDEQYDNGEIIRQAVVAVKIGDSPESLAKRILTEEHKLLPDVVKAICEEKIQWHGGHPWIT